MLMSPHQIFLPNGSTALAGPWPLFRVLKKTSGSKRNKIVGSWKKLHNQELHNSYSVPNINIMIKDDEVGRVCSSHDEAEKCIEAFYGKARRKKITMKI
jgi:hypothetical protein